MPSSSLVFHGEHEHLIRDGIQGEADMDKREHFWGPNSNYWLSAIVDVPEDTTCYSRPENLWESRLQHDHYVPEWYFPWEDETQHHGGWPTLPMPVNPEKDK